MVVVTEKQHDEQLAKVYSVTGGQVQKRARTEIEIKALVAAREQKRMDLRNTREVEDDREDDRELLEGRGVWNRHTDTFQARLLYDVV